MNTYWLILGFISCNQLLAVISTCPKKCQCTKSQIKCIYSKITLWEIEKQLCRYADITDLRLMGNSLNDSSINSLSCFKKLKFLQLSYNKLTKFPNKLLENLTFLESLYLTMNKIVELPDIIVKSRLKVVHLDNNKISDLPNSVFSRTEKLQELNLNKNKIKYLKSSTFQGLTMLEKIYLESNLIENIAPKSFEMCHNLKEIYLQSNKLKYISTNIFKNNLKMTKIFLNENLLQNLSLELFAGLSLDKLYLYGNNFTAFDRDLFYNTKSIKEFFTNDNPLQCTCALIKFRKTYETKFLNSRIAWGYCKDLQTLKYKKVISLQRNDLNCSACSVAVCPYKNSTCVPVNNTYRCEYLVTSEITLSTSKPRQKTDAITSKQQNPTDSINDVIIIISILVAVGLMAFAGIAVLVLYRTKKQKFSLDEGESVLASTADLSVNGSIKLESLKRTPNSDYKKASKCSGVDIDEEMYMMIPKLVIQC